MGPIPPVVTGRRNQQQRRMTATQQPTQEACRTAPAASGGAAQASNPTSPDSISATSPNSQTPRMSLFGSNSSPYENSAEQIPLTTIRHQPLTSSQSVDSLLTAINSTSSNNNAQKMSSRQPAQDLPNASLAKLHQTPNDSHSMSNDNRSTSGENPDTTPQTGQNAGSSASATASSSNATASEETTMHLMDRCGIHHFDDDDVYSCPAEGGPRGVTAGGRNKSGNNASGVSVSARNYSASDSNEFRRLPDDVADTDSDGAEDEDVGGEDNGCGFPLLAVAQPHARKRRQSSGEEETVDEVQPAYDQDVIDQIAEHNRRIIHSDCDDDDDNAEAAAEMLYGAGDCDDTMPSSSSHGMSRPRRHTRRNLDDGGNDQGLYQSSAKTRYIGIASGGLGLKSGYGTVVDGPSDDDDETERPDDQPMVGSPSGYTPFGHSRLSTYQQPYHRSKTITGAATSSSTAIKRMPLQPLHNAAAVARGSAAAAHEHAQGSTQRSLNIGGGIGPNLGWQATKTTLKERFLFVFCNETLADVHFTVGRGDQRQRIPAHKFVLSTGSAVFDAMFNGQLAADTSGNGSTEIELPDVEPAAFLALLRFLYSDDVTIGPESVMTTLYTAKKYAVPALEHACVDFLKRNLAPDNAFMLLTQARLFDEPQLAALCLEIIDKNTTDALNAEGFAEIDLETLCAVLERDTLRVREAPLFQALVRWATEECHRQQLPVIPDNQRAVLGRALGMIRFPLMTVEEFAQNAAQSRILHDREVVNLFLYFTVNPKPSVGFLDVPRCCVIGKEQVVSRFQRIEGRWGYSGTPDRIKFTVDRRIFVVGFGLYGSIHGPTEYQTTIQIIHQGTGKVLANNETSFQCDGSSTTFRVLFKEPVEIAPSVTYIASACLKGPDSHYGTKGLRRIMHQSPANGCVTFQFTYAAGNNNGTSVEDGQIPEIIFYSKLN